MTDLKDYLHYFQGLAGAHKEINDFFIMDINEPLEAMRGDIRYPALILNSLTGNFRSPNLDLILDEITGGFLIIGHLDNPKDFSSEMLLLQQMKQIGTDIISRMTHDVISCQLKAKKALPGFNVNTVKYQMMDGIFENGYGFLYTFKIFTPIDLDYKSTKWDDTRVIQDRTAY